jgi:hypothetical protein
VISELGGIDLARSLEKNTGIQVLHLSGNKMSHTGVAAIARSHIKELYLGTYQAIP